jgi:hypothetical protein
VTDGIWAQAQKRRPKIFEELICKRPQKGFDTVNSYHYLIISGLWSSDWQLLSELLQYSDHFDSNIIF